MTTRSFIARPTEAGGYDGIYVHLDGLPSHHLPLLLTAFQYRFNRDLEAMSRHLVDDVAIGWDELGTDLLDHAPPELFVALTGGETWPSTQPENLWTLDGSPPQRMTVNPEATDDLEWGYVLHPHGIEVISLSEQHRGPVVGWATDPLYPFSDHPAMWAPTGPGPGRVPRTAPKLSTTPVATSVSAPASLSRTTRR